MVRPSQEHDEQQSQALDRLMRLQALTNSLSEVVTADQAADAILTQTLAVLGASAAVLYRLSEDGTEFGRVGLAGPSDELTDQFLAHARTLLSDAVREGRLVIMSALADSRPRAVQATVFALPLRLQGKPVGGIALLFSTGRTFTDQDQGFLLTVAGLCAQALERARREDVDRAARERGKQEAEERSRATEALRQSEQRFRITARATGVTLFQQDLHLRYTWVANPLSGYSLDAMVGKTDDEIIHPIEDAAAFLRAKRKVLTTGQSRRVDVTARSAGRLAYYEVTLVPMRDHSGRVVGLMGAGVVVTERRQALDEVRRREQEFRTLVENTPALVVRFDRNYRHLYATRQMENVTGIPAAAYLGKSNRELGMPEDLCAETEARLRQVFRTGEVATMEFTLPSPAGPRHFQTWFGPEVSRSGSVESVIGITCNVTEQKELENELRRGMDELTDAHRRKDEFLATLAHELRNPLAPLRNGLQLLRPDGGDEQMRQQVHGMMERQLQQMVRLIDDLLDVSRITQGKLQLRWERVELAHILGSAVETARPLIEASGHCLTVALPAESIYLDADPTRLTQVFGNLLANAAKYTDQGGQIRLTAELRLVYPGVPGRGAEVVVTVADTGMGIAADHLPRLFEMFAQAKPALERSQGGLGIGLSLVKGLVEMHAGSVEAHSDGPGRGSEFIVRLPVVEGPTLPAVAPLCDTEPIANRPKRRILIADDNRDAAATLAMLLRLAGHNVCETHDGVDAVEAAARFRPEVAILDLGMPKMNGYDAARRLRAQPGGESLYLIALTGWGQEDDRKKAEEAGFDRHFTKPVDPRVLEKLLSSEKMKDVG
jgi:PAS domain S-box-containing protein